MKHRLTFLSLGSILLSLIAACQSVEPIPKYDGSALYQGYCASCHGPAAAGDGPVAPSLVSSMDNLRTLALRNNGVFPQKQIREAIDGRGLRSAHGVPDMPVWGWEFRRVEESPAHAKARVDALIEYLRLIQAEAS